MKKLILSLGIVFGVFLVFGSVSAANINQLQPAQTITYGEEVVINTGASNALTVTGVSRFNSGVHINGVTYFNGTMINSTTTDGVDNPITIGDTLRVDDYIYRTEVGGDNPLKVADSIVPNSDNVYMLGSSDNRFARLYSSEVISNYIYTYNLAFGSPTSSAGSIGSTSDTVSVSGENLWLTSSNPIRVSNGIVPNIDNTYMLGSSDKRFARLYSSEVTSNMLNTNNISFDSAGSIGSTSDTVSVSGENLWLTSSNPIQLRNRIKLQEQDGTSLPTCNSSHYGEILFSADSVGAGDANRFYMCDGRNTWTEL